jgi:nitroreductase
MTHPKHAQTDHEVLDVIRHRWSPRAFDGARAVPRDDLRRMFEAARWAPSSGNEQPWRFIVIDRFASPEPFARTLASLTERNQLWAKAAPVLALLAVRTTLEKSGAANSAAVYDAGQASAFMILQATSMGLSVRQMEGFDHERATSACDVPLPFHPLVIMAIGYSGDPEALEHERHREQERQPRSRRPIGEFVFENAWGQDLR